MSFTQINADNPKVIPATEEKIYDKLWMESFRVIARTPQSEAKAIAHMLPYDGAGHIEPNGTKTIIEIDNLFAVAVKRLEIAQAMELVFQGVNNWIQDKKWFNETVQPILIKQNNGEALTQEELDLIQLAKDKALIL